MYMQASLVPRPTASDIALQVTKVSGNEPIDLVQDVTCPCMVLRKWRLKGVCVPGVEVLPTSFRGDVKLLILSTKPFMESVHAEKEGKQIWESTFRRTQVTHAHTSMLLLLIW